MTALFLSTFENKIDKKGRVSTPASFRNALKASSFKGFVAFRSMTLPAIEGFSMEHMTTFAQNIDHFELFSEDQTDLTASVFADADPLSFDSEGRILLNTSLITHAELQDQVMFVGRGPTFQLWHPENFKTYQQEARARLKLRKPLMPKASHLTTVQPLNEKGRETS